MSATLNTILSQFVLLPTSLLITLVIGCVLLYKRCNRSALCLLVASIGGLSVLSMPFTAQRLVQSLEIYPAVSPAMLAKAQAIVVLGGGINPDQPEYAADVLNATSLERVRYAAFLYREHELPILVTGGNPGGGEAEGWVMKRALEGLFNVPVHWLETQSINTAENAQFSWKILGKQGITTIALVTHATHMPRAKQVFEQAGFTVIPAPTGFHNVETKGVMNFIPQANSLGLSNLALKEWVGRLWYWARKTVDVRGDKQ